MERIEIQRFTQQFLEHPKKQEVVDWKDDGFQNGWTILHTVIYRGRLDLAKSLLEYGADPNIATNHGQTPLMMACRAGYTESVKLILAKGANIAMVDDSGRTALSWARQDCQHANVKLLLAKVAEDPNFFLISCLCFLASRQLFH